MLVEGSVGFLVHLMSGGDDFCTSHFIVASMGVKECWSIRSNGKYPRRNIYL